MIMVLDSEVDLMLLSYRGGATQVLLMLNRRVCKLYRRESERSRQIVWAAASSTLRPVRVLNYRPRRILGYDSTTKKNILLGR